ncbi:unnamed protein product, partial [Rotaria magnacalcarata]
THHHESNFVEEAQTLENNDEITPTELTNANNLETQLSNENIVTIAEYYPNGKYRCFINIIIQLNDTHIKGLNSKIRKTDLSRRYQASV